MSRIDNLSFTVGNRHVTWVLDQIAQGVWEETTFDVIDTYCHDGGTFIDIGAWIGVFSLYAANLYGCDVVSYEPDPFAYEMLATNVTNNDLEPLIDTQRVAVWNENTQLTLRYHDGEGSSMTGITREGPSFIANTVTPAQIADDYPSPFLIKIDVEGAEQIIFPSLFAAFPDTPIIADLHYPFIPHKDRGMPIPRPHETLFDPGGGMMQVLIHPEGYNIPSRPTRKDKPIMAKKEDLEAAAQDALNHLSNLREESRMSAEDQTSINNARSALSDVLAAE